MQPYAKEQALTILIASIPRSGTHFLIDSILSVIESPTDYFCEGYSCASLDKDKITRVCPSASDKNIGERRICFSSRKLMKTHDFDLVINNTNFDKTFVVVRKNLWSSVNAWFRATTIYKWEDYNYNFDNFKEFAASKMEYYENFLEKYKSQPNSTFIYYENMQNRFYIVKSVRRIYKELEGRKLDLIPTSRLLFTPEHKFHQKRKNRKCYGEEKLHKKYLQLEEKFLNRG